jgi:gliding motility-associated-like protein
MKKILILQLLFTTLVFSQQEASVWYFGQNAGIKFNNDGTITTLTDGQLNTSEGCATIADTNGDLLFYTDGIKVWNKNHQIMTNGTGLLGDPSSTQSATIVPIPGSSTLFYIFTLDSFAGVNGFRYSEVDISLNGGLGDVTANKNVLIYTPTNEKLAIVKHANNIDYWIVTHGWNNNIFYSYLLTSTGLSATPTISNVGAVISGSTDTVFGYMKIAPNGSKIALCNSTIDSELLDFDSLTGVISNPIILNTTNDGFHYGIEFSSNSEMLYLSVIGYFPIPCQIIQFNLTATNIIASAQTVYSNTSIIPTALQLGVDGKIYFGQYYRDKLGVINNPNIIGSGCNVQTNAVDLAGRICNLGLPPFITSLFNASFTSENLCLGAVTQFTLNTNQTVISVFWDFGDGFTSTDTNPVHQYTNSGTYNVIVTVTTTNGTVTKSRQITISTVPIIANTISNQSLCGTVTMSYNLTPFNAVVLGSQSASVYGVAYFISLANATSHTNAFATSYNLPLGTTTLYAKVYNLSNVNCFAVTSFTVTLFSQPIANTASNLFVCDDVTNDGIGNFNLQNNTASVLGSQNTSDYTVSYHYTQNDADMDVNPLALNYQNTSNPQTIYVRIENNLNATCFETTSFQIGLYVLPIANQPSNLYECDAGNDGIESFNLSVQDAVVLGSQTVGNFTIHYYSSQADADSGTNPLANTVTITNSKTIYVRIENVLSSSCYATAFFDLIVEPSPVITMQTRYTICEGVPITITAPSGFSSYAWSNGSMIQTATISQAGSYTLMVTQNYGFIICSDTETITVLNSNMATITNIETLDWTATENSITVFATGDGDYEYSIDGIHYQDSNQFYGLISGQYTVFVRDKKGCGIVDEEVFLLMYPKFFTPNSDAINDFWKIKFSNNEPNMVITIYDRYGKLLKKVSSLSDGWDGTYNGQPLLADDYWFVVKRENGKEYKGHFALKR